MIEIEKVKVNNKRELETKEMQYIEQLNATLNTFVPTKTKKIYNEKRYEKFTCICGGKYTFSSQTHHFKTLKHTDYLYHNLINKIFYQKIINFIQS